MKEGTGLGFSDYFKYKLRQKLQFHPKIPGPKTPQTVHGLQPPGTRPLFRKIETPQNNPQNSRELLPKASLRISTQRGQDQCPTLLLITHGRHPGMGSQVPKERQGKQKLQIHCDLQVPEKEGHLVSQGISIL